MDQFKCYKIYKENGKFKVDDKLFDTLEQALKYVDEMEKKYEHKTKVR